MRNFSEKFPSETQREEELLRSALNSLRSRLGLGEKPKEKYAFFQFKEARDDLFEFVKSISEYLHDNEIPNLVIIDRSSRPLYMGVIEYWRSRYPDEKMPGIYFLNPKGFKQRESLSRYDIEKIQLDSRFKHDALESPQKIRTKQEVLEEFEEVYHKLLADKDKPVLVFDSCIHSGDTLDPVKKTMEEAGFEDIMIGSINPVGRRSRVRTDFHITSKDPEKGCYPFDKDRMIEKVFDHVYSQRTSDPQKRQLSIELRKEIKRIIDEHLPVQR
ncbi:MAG: hypothetical protein A3J46_00670 [Candidatus Yanofskybacteria bacterium RIFCSPHIGHO2_02_FULL_41_11]|uniref:Phosphoribosyltransferase domain-containing protein n=1 Tax=Candidatus Yanofskybacteria bacterium RIFCSPHIGHO2_02_FULL_41_11 TaxID=1802675 RepID=A0A1F8FAY8_9BACT|nr:MAG: hypothetical protein A3J46_00670 [Candidatus Yanofskybacteria bacterium RIFCSPHIGHO2_02_FULL_41_11]